MKQQHILRSSHLSILFVFFLLCTGISLTSAQNITVYPQVDTLSLWGTCTPPGFICTLDRTNEGVDRIIVRPQDGEFICGIQFGPVIAQYDSAYFQVRDSLKLNQYEIYYTNTYSIHSVRFKVPFDSLVCSYEGQCKLTLVVIRDSAIVDSAILSFDSFQTGGVEGDQSNIPHKLVLLQNYPNPLNPSTTISFSLPAKSFVTMKVYDIVGREITTIVSEELSAGNHSRQWNAAGMPSGIYFYRLQAGSYTETKKLILLR